MAYQHASRKFFTFFGSHAVSFLLWLQTELLDQNKRFISAVDYYFIQDDGSRFKVRFFGFEVTWATK